MVNGDNTDEYNAYTKNYDYAQNLGLCFFITPPKNSDVEGMKTGVGIGQEEVKNLVWGEGRV